MAACLCYNYPMKKFKKAYVEITNACNLDCGFCHKTRRKKEFMPKELFGEILRKIKGHSEYLYFHVMGEPLLHPEIGPFLDMCREHGFRVNLATNGTQMEALDAIKTKPALRQVNFSLHSESKGEAERYMEDIFRFIDSARGTPLLICLRLWAQSGNNRQILDLINGKFGPEKPVQDAATGVRGIKLAENVWLNQAEQFSWPDMKAPVIGDKGFCYGLREQFAILADGTVVPCCLDAEGALALGNIKDSSLAGLINGKRARNIYEGFSKREAREELCRRCNYRTRFGKE